MPLIKRTFYPTPHQCFGAEGRVQAMSALQGPGLTMSNEDAGPVLGAGPGARSKFWRWLQEHGCSAKAAYLLSYKAVEGWLL